MLQLFDRYPIPPPAVPGSSGSLFLYQQPSSVSIVDGVAGWGHDTRAGWQPLAGGNSSVYYVTDCGNPSLTLPTPSNSTYSGCTLMAALEHNVDRKIIIILQSGSFDLTSTVQEINLRGNSVCLIGFTCRSGTGYGNAIKTRCPIIIRGSHVYVSGLRIFLDPGGSIPPYPAGDQRDGFQVWPGATHVVIDRTEVYGAIDESFDFSQAAGPVSLCRSIAASPNSNSGIHSSGHNYGVIFPYGAGTKASAQRNAFFNCAARAPLGYSERTFWANTLLHNISDGVGNNSQVIQIDRHPSDTTSAAAHSAVIAHCQVSNGPQGYLDNWVITANGQQVGTQIYAVGMRAVGFSRVSTSDPISFFGLEPNHEARPFRVLTIPADTVPDGCGASLQYVDALTDDLMLSTYLRTECGQHPKARGDSQIPDLFTQYENFVNGTGSNYGAVQTTPTFPTLTNFVIDITNPAHVTAYHGGISIPDHTTRNNVGANSRTLIEDAIRLIGALSIGP